MKRYYYLKIFSSVICLLMINCGHPGVSADKEGRKNPASETANSPVDVKVFHVIPQVFNQELLANGKLSALKKANLKFRSEGTIIRMAVSDGETVKAEQLVALLDTAQLMGTLRQSRLDLQKAWLDYADQLLRAGYQLKDTAALPSPVKEVARLRSGLSAAESNWQQRQQELSNTRLTSPFSGKIANVKATPYSNSTSFEYVCTLVDDGELVVNFQVLEQELPFIRSSRRVEVIPFADDSSHYTGSITSINPLIDEAGMVQIKARIANPGHRLLDGMSVRVLVQQQVAHQLVVPKEAVLDRQGRKVVFTMVDSLAKWNYVEIAAENSREYAIKEGLKAGDQVIVGGNFNLAHDRPVRIRDMVKKN